MTPSEPYLLQLPRELRDHIYRDLFDATRLSYGQRLLFKEKSSSLKQTKPALHSLAILNTCHQIYAEARVIWIGHVTFNFENPWAFIEKLSKLSDDSISRMRHARILFYHIECNQLLSFNTGHSTTYYLPTILRLFPRLQLDTLTILHNSAPGPEYPTERSSNPEKLPKVLLSMFLEKSAGWRHLYFVGKYYSHQHFDVFTSEKNPKRRRLIDWNEKIRARDGEHSGSLVEVYGLSIPEEVGTVRNPFKNKMSIDSGTEFEELFVMVRRGKGVQIQQSLQYEPFEDENPEDIVHSRDQLGWNQFLQAHCKHLGPRKSQMASGTVSGVIVDEYTHVDDFKWLRGELCDIYSD